MVKPRDGGASVTEPRQVYGGPSGQRDLGRVYVTPQDADGVQAARIAITRRLLAAPARGRRRTLPVPPRLGTLLSVNRLAAWGVRCFVTAWKDGQRGWPTDLTDPKKRTAHLTGRDRLIGACRVPPEEADLFANACLDFIQTYQQELTRCEFVTLAVILLTHLVGSGEPLEDLPPPPWVPTAAFQAFLKTVRQQT